MHLPESRLSGRCIVPSLFLGQLYLNQKPAGLKLASQVNHFSVILVQAAYFSLAANEKSHDRSARAPRERGVVRLTLVVVEELGRFLIAPQAIFFSIASSNRETDRCFSGAGDR